MTICSRTVLRAPLRYTLRTTAPAAFRQLTPQRRLGTFAVRPKLAASHTLTQRRPLRSLADLEALTLPTEELEHSMASTAPPAVRDQPESGVATPSTAPPSIILTLSCPDRQGIVHAVSGWLASRGLNIRDSAQFGDATTSRFFMRVHAEAFKDSAKGAGLTAERLREEFQRDLGGDMQMTFEVHPDDEKPRTLIMVSKIGRE